MADSIRVGHATNSSSTHSIVLLDDDRQDTRQLARAVLDVYRGWAAPGRAASRAERED